MSYLFDMNDHDDSDEYDNKVQQSYFDNFFPLCVDATYYGNESRFINHSCEPNLKSYNIVTSVESYAYHRISLFVSRNINIGDELTIDYGWDENELSIPSDIYCMCGKNRCRKYIMRSFKQSEQNYRQLVH